MTIEELNNKVQNFDLEIELNSIMLDNDDEFVKANKEMLYSGIDATGQSLGEYAPRTIEYKKEKNQPYDRITLKDSGDFYAGKKLIVIDNDYTIESSDEKQEKLNEDFGIDINSIDKERMSDLTDKILTPQLTKSLQNAIS